VLLNYNIGRFVLGSLCVGDLVRLGLSRVRVAGCNTGISTSPRGLCILHITLIARKLSKPDDDRHRPKHVVFHC